MTHTGTGPDERIDELESRLALQDHALSELGSEVYEQQKQLARLETVVRQLVDRLEQIEQAPQAGAPADETPPHY